MTADALNRTRQAEQERQQRLKDRLLCCTVAGCESCGAQEVRAAVQDQIRIQGKTSQIEVCGTGCMGLCCEGPLVRSSAADIVYTGATPADAAALVSGDRSRFEGRISQPDHPFFAGQRRIILTNSGKADPECLAEYVSTGGYQSLLRATEMTPSEIIAEVKK